MARNGTARKRPALLRRFDWTRERRLALRLWTDGETDMPDIARACGISRRQLYRWLAHPVFIAAAEAREAATREREQREREAELRSIHEEAQRRWEAEQSRREAEWNALMERLRRRTEREARSMGRR